MTQGTDLLAEPATRSSLFVAPQVALIAGFFIPPIRIVLWVIALGVLGVACVMNARRCGRLHCYLTGPFYLLAALVIGLYGIDMLDLGERGWLWLGLGVVVVGNLLTLVPERLRPRYTKAG